MVSRETEVKAFMAAASLGDLWTLNQMVEEGTDVNTVGAHRRGALSLASEKGHAVAVAFLLRAGADVNQLDEHGTTPLGYAVEQNNVKCMLILLDAGADVNKSWRGVTPLTAAAEKGHSECLRFLIQGGADVNRWHHLIEALENGHTMCVLWLLHAGADVNEVSAMGNTPLIAAASKGHLQCVNILIQAGANVNVRNSWPGDTALTLASQGGHSQCVQILIQAGADVNQASLEVSPIMEATSYGRNRCVLLLTIAGANANEAARPLVEASAGGHSLSVEVLLRAGAGVNLMDPFHQTALIAAIGEQHVRCVYPNIYGNTSGEYARCVSLLLEAGADVNQFGYNDWHKFVGPPLALASLTCNVKAVCQLLHRGAKINVILHDLRKRRDTDSVARSRVARLLFAAGETKVFVDVVNPVKSGAESENHLQLDIKNICRRTIRKHLLHLDPHENLFIRVPRLGLKVALQRFILYDVACGDN